MRILDLFCGAGGAAMGFHRAFPDADIFGIDIESQPSYPFFFKKTDAIDYPLDGFDLIHASPPCQDHSSLARVNQNKAGTAWMLGHTIDRLAAHGGSWVVENVEGAQMPASPHAVKLCGSMFGLDVRRHRKFALSFPVEQPKCNHAAQTPRFVSLNAYQRRKGILASVVSVHGKTHYAGEAEIRRKAMDIDWMDGVEISQAIPPAYTEHIGNALKVLL